ncbi:outer membrane protein [Flavobacterium sp.]|jgi:hypothetical protein|uniref:outer membrane protein n=1 Tax=Flavobacterium sp. TaxID=239 RepID=UPI0037BF52B4
MKKNLFTAILLVVLACSGQAQNLSKNALGLRLGDNDGFGGEISYQRAISSDTRLEFDLGWRNSKDYDAVKLAALHQWVWNIDGGFNWYAGVGGGIGSWKTNTYYINNVKYKGDSNTVLFAAGDIGIEYNFDIPLQLSLDFRPEIYFSDSINDDFGPDVALGIRYKF